MYIHEYQTFVFETANGCLLKLLHGTKCVALQIVNKFLLHRAVPFFTTKYAVSEQVKEFCLELTNDRRVKSFTKYHDTTVLDNGRVTETTADEKSAFISAQKNYTEQICKDFDSNILWPFRF